MIDTQNTKKLVVCAVSVAALVFRNEAIGERKNALTCDRNCRNCKRLLYPHLRFSAVGYSISFLYCHILGMSAESQHPFGHHPRSEFVLQKALSEGRKEKPRALTWW